jgi:16S rRNA (guanine527-N7)-methyltransferase
MTRSTDQRGSGPSGGVSAARLSALLRPFVSSPPDDRQVAALSTYLNLLLRWNARLNLTAARSADEIITRHIGESLFAAERLLPSRDTDLRAIDLGSGAGFPGVPLKVYASRLQLTLIESKQKKATFLKEVFRALRFPDACVFAGRAEVFPGRADLVTLRAVECFERVLPVAASLLDPGIRAKEETGPATEERLPGAPRLALLIGASQADRARELLPGFKWEAPVAIPQSSARILLVGYPGGAL